MMTDETTLNMIEEKLNGLNTYLRGLQLFPGNAAMKWIANGCARTALNITDVKKSIKNLKEIIKYTEELPWFKGNAGLQFVHKELSDSLEILSGKAVAPEPDPEPDSKSDPEKDKDKDKDKGKDKDKKPDYDDPNPKPSEDDPE